MTSEQSKQIEVIYRTTNLNGESHTVDDFFDDPFEALHLISSVLVSGDSIEFIAIPNVTECYDIKRKEVYYS